ncbi:MAG: hypothetical protein WCC69_09850 [Pirellulales bacterium]
MPVSEPIVSENPASFRAAPAAIETRVESASALAAASASVPPEIVVAPV